MPCISQGYPYFVDILVSQINFVYLSLNTTKGISIMLKLAQLLWLLTAPWLATWNMISRFTRCAKLSWTPRQYHTEKCIYTSRDVWSRKHESDSEADYCWPQLYCTPQNILSIITWHTPQFTAQFRMQLLTHSLNFNGCVVEVWE